MGEQENVFSPVERIKMARSIKQKEADHAEPVMDSLGAASGGVY